MALLLAIQLRYPLLPLYSIGYMLGTSLLHTFVVEDEKEEYEHGLEEKSKLEDRLVFQERLFEQEREKHRSDALLTAMSLDYLGIFYLDLDKEEAVCYQADARLCEGVRKGDPDPGGLTAPRPFAQKPREPEALPLWVRGAVVFRFISGTPPPHK